MEPNELIHYGILGMKWGVRRYQNKDGSLTNAGKKRYGEGDGNIAKTVLKKASDAADKSMEKARHETRIKTDPIYAARNRTQPWNEKPSTEAPWSEKSGGSRNLVESKPRQEPWHEKPSKNQPWNEKPQSASVTSQKERSRMTDAELKQKIQRLEMETKLKDLEKRNVDAGREYVDSILKDVGRKVIVTAATGAILYGAKTAAGGEFNVAELANAIFNGGAKKK